MGEQQSHYLVLSLDGGGVRGAYQARMLERIEAAHPFLHKVKLIAGSSIGGVNAMALASGLTAKDMVEFYEDHTSDIFSKRDWLDSIVGPADELFRADYDNSELKDILEKYLGDKTLADLDKKVLVTSFDLDHGEGADRAWKAKIFHNYESPGGDGAELAVDIGLRTTAAPTYFPSHQGYADGGVVANNPTLCALGRVVKSGVNQDDVVMLSLGTGCNPTFIEGDRLDWGVKQWAPYIMPMLMDGMVDLPDYICKQLLPGRYARICPHLPGEVKLDDASKVDELIKWADDVDISPAVKLLESLS